MERRFTNKPKFLTQQAAFVRRGPKNKQTRHCPNRSGQRTQQRLSARAPLRSETDLGEHHLPSETI
eukprot:1426275-Pyramimonas_sp.AAC.1